MYDYSFGFLKQSLSGAHSHNLSEKENIVLQNAILINVLRYIENNYFLRTTVWELIAQNVICH